MRSAIRVLMALVFLSAGAGCGGTEVASTPLPTDAHVSTWLGDPFLDVPARALYDGLVVFREVRPMEHRCP